jgi:predicted phage tail protein
MLKVCLHGLLGDKFGSDWNLKVSSVKEAVRAIEANSNCLYKFLREKDHEGIAYKVVAGDPDGNESYYLSEEDLEVNIAHKREIHIIPYLSGAGDALMGILNVILGVILIVVAIVFTAGLGMWLLILAGALMIIGGALMLLMDSPDPGDYSSRRSPLQYSTASFHFSGYENVAQQGLPVPLGYGRAIVGTKVISMFVRANRFFGEASNEGSFGIQIEGLDKDNGYAPGFFTRNPQTAKSNPLSGKAPSGRGGYYPGEFGQYRLGDTDPGFVEGEEKIYDFFRPGTTSFNVAMTGVNYGAGYGFSSDVVCLDDVNPGSQSVRT